MSNSPLRTSPLRASLKNSRCAPFCTTDDPADDLKYHQAIAASGLVTRVVPAFRPDKALAVHQPVAFNEWLERLAQAANIDIADFDDFIRALDSRHEFFHSQGCRLSDHGLNVSYADDCSEKAAAAIFGRSGRGRAASPEEHAAFASS